MTLSTPARMFATLVALAALALFLVGGSASAAPVITCSNSASDQATVQTALDAGGIVTVKGTCLGNWTITVPVALFGSGGAVLDGNFTGSVLMVTNATTAVVGNLTIRNGSSDFGGGVFADFDTTVTLRSSTITGNTADEAGGGIYAQDSALVTVSGGAITHNESGNAGGGIAVLGAELSATDANVSSNLAVMGGGIAAQFSNASLLRTRVTGNTASDFAGGIASFASGSLEEVNTPTVAASRNLPFSRLMPRAPRSFAQATGPSVSALPLGFTINGSSIDHNTALLEGGGGIVNVSPGASTQLTVKNTSISFNTVTGQQGFLIGAGGIANVGGSPEDTATLDLIGSRLFGNNAGGGLGGGVYNVSQSGETILTVSNTAISSSRGLIDPNQAAYGAGIYQDATAGPASLTLGKAAGVVHNRASIDGGGIYNLCGGTITMAGGAVTLNTPNNVVQASCPP